mgnify:FL=1
MGEFMKKITQSVLVASLSATMLIQNTVVITHAQETNLSKVKKDTYISTKDSFAQVDPKTIPSTSMGESISRYSLSNELPELKTKSLISSNSIGVGNATANSLNVRSGPGSSYESLGYLSRNAKVDILARENNWYKISANNLSGYVSASYIKLSAIEKGIDVSKWNGDINWNKVKSDGIDYVIIRGGFGNSSVDQKFKSHIEGASKAGLKIGIYWFSYATSVAKAKEEAAKCLETIKPYKDKISYPVFYDFEYASVDYAKKNGINITKNLSTKMADAFLTDIKNAGYITGIYTNKDFSDKYFESDLLYANNLWIAQYNQECTYNKPYMMWQYTETGTINDIGTSSNPAYFDMNYTYLKPTNGSIAESKIDLSSASSNNIDDVTYTGNPIEPNVVLTLDNKTLKLDEDYTITYSNNTSVGTGEIIINGINRYTGTKTISFKINPQTISNVSLNSKTINSITFSWDKIDNITGYEVYKYDEFSNTYTLLDTISDNSINTYTDKNLTSASTYNYAIRAYKVIDKTTYYGNYSNIFTDSTKVNKVTNLKLDVRNATSLQISWDKVDNVDGYRIYRLDPSTNVYTLVDTIYGENITSYTHDSRVSATSYYYRVKAFKYLNGMNRYSDYSSTLKATTKPLQPVVSLSSTKTKYINLSWTKISKRTTGYEIYMSTSKNGTYTLVGTTSNKSFSKGNLTKGKTYYFKVRAYRSVDNTKIYSSYSTVKSIVCK